MFLNLKFIFSYLFSISILVFSVSFSFAGTTVDPSRTVYFGKTLGMGGAHVALSNDGEGLFTNPSGLAGLTFPQITGVSRKIFLDETSYSIYSYTIPSDFGSFGLGYAGANTGGSYATTRNSSDRIVINPSLEVISNDNSVVLLSYAKDISNYAKRPISLGANLKFFNQSLTGGGISSRGTAMNLDLGATYIVSPWLTAGANLQNLLGGNVQWGSSSDKLGGYYKFGVAANLLGATEESLYKYSSKVIGAFDFDLPHDVLGGSMLMHAGLEWLPIKGIALRSGLNQETGGTGLTLGIGFIQDAFRFDYAYAARPGIIGDNPHYFSLSYTGARTVSYQKKTKSKESAIVFLSPKDKSIVSEEVVAIKAEAKYNSIIDQKTIWTVPLFSSTSESHEVKEAYDLQNVSFNGERIVQTGTIEVRSPAMSYGRHAFAVSGLITPEKAMATGEVRLLRFEPLSDVAMDYWAIEPIALNSVLGLIKGYPDKSFKPEKGISRAELTALLVRTLDLSLEAGRLTNFVKFKDIPSTHWAANFIGIGAALGLVQGYPDGTFKGNKTLNRAEGITVLSRYAKLAEKEGISSFADIKDTFWANKYINPAKEAGLLKYLEGMSFEATRAFSRAEASEVLYRTPQVQKMTNNYWDIGITPQTGDIPEWILKLIGAPAIKTTETSIETMESTNEVSAPKTAPVKKSISYTVKKLKPKPASTSTGKKGSSF